ncbi:hypothetical protein QQ054_21505 [Oscillatoria amoena NRMC-F 0135]|nr:hypothetical protein [Oscillatoria amoena NRMC-F 0135]
MFIPFDQLPESSRIWIYQTDRQLTTTEVNAMSDHLRSFSERWTTHAKPMRASFIVWHDQFIVLAADESKNGASGCAIDESVNALKEIEQLFSVHLLNRGVVTFLQNDKTVTIPIAALQSALAEGQWNANSLVVDTTVRTIGEMKNRWIQPAKSTWLNRYLSKVVA